METNFWKFWPTINHPWGSCEVPHKIGAQSIQSFWRLLAINKQTPRQTDEQVYIQISSVSYIFREESGRGSAGVFLSKKLNFFFYQNTSVFSIIFTSYYEHGLFFCNYLKIFFLIKMIYHVEIYRSEQGPREWIKQEKVF